MSVSVEGLRKDNVRRLPSAKEAADEEQKRMEAWLSERVAKAQEAPVVEIVTLTPTLAGILLARNEHNRPISETNLDRVKRDIANGHWEFNGESIIISKDGLLNNGQHRCKAVLETGKSIPIVIVFGPLRRSRMTLDQGVTRTVGHFLSMHGYSNANLLGSVAGYIWQYFQYSRLATNGKMRSTKSEALLVAEKYKDIGDSVDFVSRNGVGAICSRSVLAFAHWAIRHRAPNASFEPADEFIDKLIEGRDLQRRDPILYARNRLMGMTGSASNINERAEIIFRAWNAHRRLERIDRLVVLGKELPALEL